MHLEVLIGYHDTFALAFVPFNELDCTTEHRCRSTTKAA
jgi:hypothetical protein